MIAMLGIPNVVTVALVSVLVAGVFRSRVVGANERRTTRWSDAWLKASLIVVFVVFFVVFLPSYVMQTETVAGFDKNAQDMIGSGLFFAGFAATVGGLWFAYRTKRV